MVLNNNLIHIFKELNFLKGFPKKGKDWYLCGDPLNSFYFRKPPSISMRILWTTLSSYCERSRKVEQAVCQ